MIIVIKRYLRKFVFLFSLLVSSLFSVSQQKPLTVKDKRWQHLDLIQDSVYGISMDKAYSQLLSKRTGTTVIVAVIDAGTDTHHTDLSPVLWENRKELGNDEDRNGYLNDRKGWNFLGVKGKEPIKPGFEYERVYLSLRDKCSCYTEAEILKNKDADCIAWLTTRDKFRTDSAQSIKANLSFWKNAEDEDSTWRVVLGKRIYMAKDILDFIKVQNKNSVGEVMLSFLMRDSTRTNVVQMAMIEEAKRKLYNKYRQNPVAHRLETTGDNYNDIEDRFYGNADVRGTGFHGTHVSGIIAAKRNNGFGIDGIADNVELMSVRAVYDRADEYDKDVALAIRYAVDNGAKVINMSFGKLYSPEQKWVEEAIRYAAKKDVLIIHAAGNNAINIDSVTHYPTAKYLNGKYAPNVITVGASGANRENFIASFSNYGVKEVDVFAPGISIYSTVTEHDTSGYALASGTSMAAPVVAGIAAVLRSYFPELTAREVKYVIEHSVLKIEGYVTKPGVGRKQVLMKELCRTGGIVNAYNAVVAAEELMKLNKRRRKAVTNR